MAVALDHAASQLPRGAAVDEVCNCNQKFDGLSRKSAVESSTNDMKGSFHTHLLPSGTFDTHAHVFDPSLGPYSADRAYTPGTATFQELCAFSSGISSTDKPANFVLVQPSPYRYDNRVLMSVLRQCQTDGVFARAIAVFDYNTVSDKDLLEMHELGVRGLRLNLQADGHRVNITALDNALKAAADRIRHLPNWKIQIFAPAHVWKDLYPTLSNLPVVVIADHTGGLLAASKLDAEFKKDPLQQKGLEELMNLADRSKVLIKVSGLYRSSSDTSTAYADMAPLIRELATRVPDSLVWGSDWPHTGEGKDRAASKNRDDIEPFRKIDNESVLSNLRSWVGNDQKWVKMMVYNPREAYR